MDQACRWVIKYFSCLLFNAVPNDDIVVTSVQHAVVTAAICQWRRRLSACVQAGGGHFAAADPGEVRWVRTNPPPLWPGVVVENARTAWLYQSSKRYFH